MKPRDLKVGILKLRRTQKGVSITTSSKEGTSLLDAAIKENEKLKQLDTKIPELKRPKLILYNVNSNTTETEVLEALSQQNDVEGEDFKILFKMERQHGTHWVLELSPEVFRSLKNKKRLFIGWQSVNVR